jgi:hypothetical protein
MSAQTKNPIISRTSPPYRQRVAGDYRPVGRRSTCARATSLRGSVGLWPRREGRTTIGGPGDTESQPRSCRRAPPAILRICPPGTLTLSHARVGPPRYSLASSYVALVAIPEDLRPGIEAILRQAPGGQVAALVVQQIEGHEQRWRGDGSGVRLAQPVEAGSELFVVDRHLAVEHQRARGQLRDGGGQVSEAASVVAPVAADQANAVAVLVRQPYGVFTLLQIDSLGTPGALVYSDRASSP